MNKSCVIKSWSSKHDIPKYLCSNILSRLPVKSLLRFRCVSKSWSTLIDNPDFCRLHLNNFNINPNETHLFAGVDHLDEGTKFCIVSSCRDTIHELPTWIQYPLDTMQFSKNWGVVSSMDGLVMLQDNNEYTGFIMLWNPSITRARILPTSPVIVDAIPEGISNVNLGFGFDPLIKDYKLVRLVYSDRHHCEGKLISVLVYTVGTGLWKAIRFHAKGISEWCWSFIGVCGRKSVYFRGALYFILRRLNSRARHLVSFDLSKEEFSSTVLPAECYDLNSDKYRILVIDDGGCSLRLMYFALTKPTEISMWKLENSNSKADMPCIFWTKCYTFSPIPGIYAGRLLSYGCRGVPVLYLKKTDDFVVPSGRKELISYHLGTHKRKTLLGVELGELLLDRACRYKESLVLLKG